MDRLEDLESLVVHSLRIPPTEREVTILRYKNYIDDELANLAPDPPPNVQAGAGLSDVTRYVTAVKQLQWAEPQLVRLLELWLEFCREAARPSGNEESRRAAQAHATIVDDAIQLWWRQLHYRNGLVRTMLEQARLVKLFSIMGRHGDYTSVTLNDLKQNVKLEDVLKALIGARDWVQVDDKVGQEEVRHIAFVNIEVKARPVLS
jgi:hypothetical protein